MYVRKSHDHSFEILGLDEDQLQLLMLGAASLSEDTRLNEKDKGKCASLWARISHFLEERRSATSGFNRIGQKG